MSYCLHQCDWVNTDHVKLFACSNMTGKALCSECLYHSLLVISGSGHFEYEHSTLTLLLLFYYFEFLLLFRIGCCVFVFHLEAQS